MPIKLTCIGRTKYGECEHGGMDCIHTGRIENNNFIRTGTSKKWPVFYKSGTVMGVQLEKPSSCSNGKHRFYQWEMLHD